MEQIFFGGVRQKTSRTDFMMLAVKNKDDLAGLFQNQFTIIFQTENREREQIVVHIVNGLL